jgi:hypothetical protein
MNLIFRHVAVENNAAKRAAYIIVQLAADPQPFI